MLLNIELVAATILHVGSDEQACQGHRDQA